jgi:hypothetical protein
MREKPPFEDFEIDIDGNVSFDVKEGDVYLVTGKTVYGERFSQSHTNVRAAFSINLYDGRIWLVRGNKRRLIKRVTR